jgi:hypothetical protein
MKNYIISIEDGENLIEYPNLKKKKWIQLPEVN